MYSPAELESLISRLIAKELPKVEWTHKAHLATAIWHLWHFPPADAHFLMKGRIIKHNESVGTVNSDTEGYHETLTLFWLKAVKHFLDAHQFSHPIEAIKEMDKSELASSEFPLSFYSKEVLFGNSKARKEWVLPDLVVPDWIGKP